MSTDDQTTDRVMLPSLETPTLTKAELAELLFDRLGLNKRESKDMVEAFFELVHNTLTEGQDVTSQYVDTQSRLKTMSASVDRVRALMSRARRRPSRGPRSKTSSRRSRASRPPACRTTTAPSSRRSTAT